jgi:predicted outer membrane repeat protein
MITKYRPAGKNETNQLKAGDGGRKLLAVILVGLSILGASAANGAVQMVTNTNDSGPGSLRDAITVAASGDTVNFAVTGGISVLSSLTIDKTLSIEGPGAYILNVQRDPGLSDDNQFPVFVVSGAGLEVRIASLGVSNGRATTCTDIPCGEIGFSFGGGINNYQANLTVDSCYIHDNVASIGGAGISNGGTLTVVNTTFRGNKIVNAALGKYGGGALANNGSVATLNNCTFDGNYGPAGGAIRNTLGTLTVNNCTFANNQAVTGGAIYSENADAIGLIAPAAATITCCTFSGDFATGETFLNASEVFNVNLPNDNDWEGTMTLANSIFCGASAGPEIAAFIPGGGITSMGYNVACGFDASTFLTGPNDRSAVDPKLDPNGLNFNGGITETIRPLLGSPLINAGKSFGLSTDQRGQPRPFDFPGVDSVAGGDGSDIGAYEVNEHAPVAKCQNITVPAGPDCTAPALIDAGSYDPDLGDEITLSQSPPGPFALGTTMVTLTVTDLYGETSSCQSTVTVVDQTPPVVSGTVAVSILNKRNHDLVNVGLAATATDNCSAPTSLQVQVFGNEDDQTPTATGTVFSPDATNLAVGTLKLRAECLDSGNGRVYLIVVTGADSSGNVGFSGNTVVVPHDGSPAGLATITSLAAKALTYCQAHNGAPPPGYFVIGDGPVIGSKQ